MSASTAADNVAAGGPAESATALVVRRPQGLDDRAAGDLASKAEGLAASILAQPGDHKAGRQVSAMGVREQQRASKEIGLLKTRVGTMLKQLEGGGGEIPKTLVQLRNTMDEINPQVLSQPTGLAKWLGRAPGIGKVLKRVAVKYESVQTQIDHIMAGLRHGKDKLLMDSAELEQLYEQVGTAQQGVQQSAYVGELLWQKLEEASDESADPARRQKLQAMMQRVAMRVQDLRTMEQVNLQFFVSIDMTLQNNDMLCEQIDRTVMVTQSLLTVGLAIQAALASQKQIATAVREVQDSTAAMLEANAAAIGQQAKEIGDMQNNPVIALDRVKNAYNSLVGAMDEMERIRSVGTEKARAGIAELTRMSAALEPRTEALRAARELPAAEIPGALPAASGEGRSAARDGD